MIPPLQEAGCIELQVRVPLVRARATDPGDGEVFVEFATNGLIFDGSISVLENDPTPNGVL